LKTAASAELTVNAKVIEHIYLSESSRLYAPKLEKVTGSAIVGTDAVMVAQSLRSTEIPGYALKLNKRSMVLGKEWTKQHEDPLAAMR
jgi:hypothetical protein